MVKSILVIEDNDELREGYKFLINSSSDKYQVVAAYNNAEDALVFLQTNSCDIILMDIDLVGMNGIEATKIIKKKYPKTEILMITVWESSEKVFEALCVGAIGYITKNGSSVEIINALDELVRGGAPMSASIARMVISTFTRNSISPLNEKETLVMNHLASGKGYKTIAKLMDVSFDSVKYYIKNIYEKLQVGNKEDAIDKAKENRWI